MATKLVETVSPSRCESGAKPDNTFSPLPNDVRTASKSDSSSDEERSAKTGSNNSLQNTLSPTQSQKRPMNAFLIFCKRHRSVVRQKYPHLENRSITKILGEWWAALDSDQKLKYTELARQYKEAFMKANPHFKWYKTTDLRPPIAPPSPPPPPPPVAPVVLAQNIITQPQPQQPQTQTQSTPKPPKKRYLENLENGEYKATSNANYNVISNASTSGGQSSATAPASAANCTNAGPPILDIETANRVIENALSGSTSKSNAVDTNREQSAFNSDIINGHINSVLEQHTIETRELEALERSSQNKTNAVGAVSGVVGNSSPNTTQSTSVDKNATNRISNQRMSSSPPTTPSDEEPEDENNEHNDDDKPLNLSASTVLHTSNQHIIDHFIDKLLSTGIGGSSSDSSALSLPFSSMSPFNSSGNDIQNKMSNNNENNSNNSKDNKTNNNYNNSNNNNNNFKDNNHCNSLSTKAQSRKDRSCKGKRYLEILSESKFGKRSRTVSQTTGQSGTDRDEGSAKGLGSNQSSAGGGTTGGSKWVSGGFDLEEHIAQLPQLGDTHLLNALSHSKANKTMNTSKSGSNDCIVSNNHSKQKSVDNCVNESNNGGVSDRSNSDIEDNDMTTTSEALGPKSRTNEPNEPKQTNDNTLKTYTTDANDSKTETGFVVDINNKQSVSETHTENMDQSVATEGQKQNMSDQSIVKTSDLVNNSLSTTQGIEFSDGLAALAEVALQQPRNTV